MTIRSEAEKNKLNSVTATIVYELNSVGVFHYNKLTYLFEYLFIKNFGTRYTKEKFIKLPHGPVIANYKNQISDLTNSQIISTDIEELNKRRKLDDDIHIQIYIEKTNLTENHTIAEPIVRDFLIRILEKYSQLTTKQLEEKVYQTTPLKKYKELHDKRFKPETGGYVLDYNGIRMTDYLNNSKVRARKTFFNHLEKYPHINFEQLKKFTKELAYLEQFRPGWEKH